MNTASFAPVLLTLFREIVGGSPDASRRTYVLNQGDAGLLASLDLLTASAASATPAGPSIAAHVDHLLYGLSLLNRWAHGTLPARQETDWTASWRRNVVSDSEWRHLRSELRREAELWMETLRQPRDVSDIEAGWLVSSVAHFAYHPGAIRQIDRSMRGPTAEDEARAQAGARG